MSITNVNSSVNSDDSVNVNASVSPNAPGQSISGVVVNYGSSSGTYTSTVTASTTDGSDYSAVIPAQTYASTLYYQVQASFDQGGNISVQDSPEGVQNIDFGGTQSSPPSMATPTDSAISISWTSSDPGIGIVNYSVNGSSTTMQDSESDSSTTHSITLSDLLPSTAYNFSYQTNFDDPNLPDAVSTSYSFSTAVDPPSSPPERTSISVSPSSIAVGGNATVTLQIQSKKGFPQSGISVSFALGAGQAQGTLSLSSGQTDANGLISTVFKATALGPKAKKGRRFIAATAGTSPQTKKRHAVVMVTA